MSEHQKALERLMATPLWSEIYAVRDWAMTITNSDKMDLFLNPQDAKGLEGCKLIGLPVCQSIGVPVGSALIFDHRSGRYIRKGEQIDWTQ